MLGIEFNNQKNHSKSTENGYLQIVKDLKQEHQELTVQLR